MEKGTKAPEFTLKDKDGNKVALSDFAGKIDENGIIEEKVCLY